MFVHLLSTYQVPGPLTRFITKSLLFQNVQSLTNKYEQQGKELTVSKRNTLNPSVGFQCWPKGERVSVQRLQLGKRVPRPDKEEERRNDLKRVGFGYQSRIQVGVSQNTHFMVWPSWSRGMTLMDHSFSLQHLLRKKLELGVKMAYFLYLKSSQSR